MSGLDLAEIRAQLRADAQERRPAPSGPLRALKALIAPDEPPPLLGPPPMRPLPPATCSGRPSSSEEPPSLGPLLLDPRRDTFGQRRDCARPLELSPPPTAEPVLELQPAEVGEALRRLRSSLRPVSEPPPETPFMPEDLLDPIEEDTDAAYESLPEIPDAAETPARALLLRLEARLVEEQMSFLRRLAGL